MFVLKRRQQSEAFINLQFTCRGPPGDLYVYLDVEEIPEIQRDGINLRSTVPISYLDAILGTVVKVKSFMLFVF